jgi:hypothetical protein
MFLYGFSVFLVDECQLALGSESYNLIEKARLYVRISEETIYPQPLFVQKHCFTRKLQRKTMMIFRYRKCRLNFLEAGLLHEVTRDGR